MAASVLRPPYPSGAAARSGCAAKENHSILDATGAQESRLHGGVIRDLIRNEQDRVDEARVQFWKEKKDGQCRFVIVRGGSVCSRRESVSSPARRVSCRDRPLRFWCSSSVFH